MKAAPASVDLDSESFTVEELVTLMEVGQDRGRHWIATHLPVREGRILRADLETLTPSVWRLLVIADQQRAPVKRPRG